MVRKTNEIQSLPSKYCWRQRDVSPDSQRRSLTKRKVRGGFPKEVTVVAARGGSRDFVACGGSGDLRGTNRD